MFHHAIIESNFRPPTLQKHHQQTSFFYLFLLGTFSFQPFVFFWCFFGASILLGGWLSQHGTDRRFRCLFFFGEGPISFLFPITLFLLAKGVGGFEPGSSRGTKKQKRTFVVVVVVDDDDDDDDHDSLGDLELWRWF